MGDNELQHNPFEEPTVRAIESLEDYLRRYGLPPADDESIGEFNGLTRIEAVERIRAEDEYRDAVIARHQSLIYSPPHRGKSPRQGNSAHSDHEGDALIAVLLSNKSRHSVSVLPLVSFCETVKRMVVSRTRFGITEGPDEESVEGDSLKEISKAIGSKGGEDGALMELSLVEFDSDAVLEFLEALVCLLDSQDTLTSNEKKPHKEENSGNTKKRRMDENNQSTHLIWVTQLIENEKISEQNIVECLKIAHFLQCRVIMDGLVPIVESSIDSKNCMSICALADTLNMQCLFEASVNHVIERLDALQGTNDGEEKDRSSSSSEEDGEEEVWKFLPHELKCRVLTMRNVMRSSVIGRGSKMSGVFFSCGNEFLAIFRETIRDQRERLVEARERRDEVIRERTVEWEERRERRGRWFDTSSQAERSFIFGGDVADALEKIEKQERRMKTLETFYEEQKLIFKSSSMDVGKGLTL